MSKYSLIKKMEQGSNHQNFVGDLMTLFQISSSATFFFSDILSGEKWHNAISKTFLRIITGKEVLFQEHYVMQKTFPVSLSHAHLH